MEVNVPACQLPACHVYKRDEDPDGMLTQVRGTAIFGKCARAYTTNVHGPILPLVEYEYRRSHLRLGEAADSDRIC